jgi:hypothetical protein
VDTPINDQTLPSIIEGEVARSIGHFDGTLSESRAQEFKYYYGEPFGNEVEGESQVVSTDVADTVEGILPIILSIFTSSDDVVRFDPNGPEDEDQANQQTETANYVFYRQNNGFLVLYQWFKDALIQKNGIVKYWWEEKTTRTTEKYKSLTEGEYRMLKEDASAIEIEELEVSQYDDPSAVEQKNQMRRQIEQQAPPEAQPTILAQLEAQPVPQLYDCELRITKDVSQICIQAIPPEEFGISALHNCVSIQDTNFCYHRTQKTISSLREMGVPEDILEEAGPANEPDITPEALARDRYVDDTWREGSGPNEVERRAWVTDCFFKVDYDGDGISELRHIIMVGRRIWTNEETDHINFAALTPIIMPHRWIGRSVAELVMDIQFTKSVLWRQMLNNLYLTNNPQKAVLSSSAGIVQANLDDLMTSRPGGILREYQPNAIRNIETPFVAGAAFPMLEYMDALKETRTGVTRYNQGTDADTLNKTARGIQMIQAAGQQRTGLIARIFAETGVKDLMKGIVYMLSKYSGRSMTLKLRNKWVDIDPREWKTQYNMTVNVGLGTGNKDVQLNHLSVIHQQQIELMKTGRGYMVSDENVFNLFKKSSEAMGFKHPELFVTDPQRIPPQAKQPPPDPAAMKVQMDAQEGQAKLQHAAQKDQLSAQTEMSVAQVQSQTQLAVAQIDAATKKEIEQMRIAAQAQLAVFDKQHDLNGAAGEIEGKKGQLEQEVLKKATELDVRELKVGYEEQILTLKKQVEQMAEQHRKELTEESVGRVENHEKAMVEPIQISLDMMAQAISQLGTMTTKQAELSKEVVEALKKPSAIKIGNVKLDKDGRITGADINRG